MSTPNAVVPAMPDVPILRDPEVREALEQVARLALEELARDFSPIYERARSLPQEAGLIPVTSEDEHGFIRAWLADEVDGTEEAAKRLLDPIATFLHRLHRSFTGLRGLVTDETKRAREVAKPKILAWANELDRRRREAEEQARREREAAELRVVVGRAPYLAHVGISQWAEIEIGEREKHEAAERAREAGDLEVADAIADEIGKIEEPTIQPELEPVLPLVAAPVSVPEKPKGIAKNWRARLTDRMKLIRYVAAHPEYENLLELDQGAADRLAKALEDKLAIPGLEAFNEPTVRRGRR